MKRPQDSVTVLLINDIHVGSKASLWPAGFPTHAGSVPSHNQHQEYLHAHWKEFTGKWLPSKLPRWGIGPQWARRQGKFDYLVFVGDLVDGDQYKRGGVGVVDPDPLQQARAAIRLLEPIRAMCKKAYLVAGTGYHVGNYGVWSRYLGEALNCEPFEQKGQSAPVRYAIPWLRGLLSNGVNVDIAHTQSIMLRYRSTPLEREQQFSAMVPEAVGGGQADLIVRAHSHHYHVVVEEESRYALSLAGWQCQYDYLSGGKIPNRALAITLGTTLLTLEPRKLGKPWCRIDNYHFAHPRIFKKVL
jgi:hypothetical protein